METNEGIGRAVRCDACGCAFRPEVKTQEEDGIEYSYFNCDYCGKAFMVSVTDAELRKNIAEYLKLASLNKAKRLDERKQRRMQRLKAANVARGRELRKQYLKETGDGE